MAFFRIHDIAGNGVDFTKKEATDNKKVPTYSFEIGSEASASGQIKQQIRPGKRYKKEYLMVLTETKYIELANLLTNGANDYYILFDTTVCLLDNDPNVPVSRENDFKIAITIKDARIITGTPEINYHFPFSFSSAVLL